MTYAQTVSELLDEAFRLYAADLEAAQVHFVERVLALLAVPVSDEECTDD